MSLPTFRVDPMCLVDRPTIVNVVPVIRRRIRWIDPERLYRIDQL
jgi:hypothetical protein